MKNKSLLSDDRERYVVGGLATALSKLLRSSLKKVYNIPYDLTYLTKAKALSTEVKNIDKHIASFTESDQLAKQINLKSDFPDFHKIYPDTVKEIDRVIEVYPQLDFIIKHNESLQEEALDKFGIGRSDFSIEDLFMGEESEKALGFLTDYARKYKRQIDSLMEATQEAERIIKKQGKGELVPVLVRTTKSEGPSKITGIRDPELVDEKTTELEEFFTKNKDALEQSDSEEYDNFIKELEKKLGAAHFSQFPEDALREPKLTKEAIADLHTRLEQRTLGQFNDLNKGLPGRSQKASEVINHMASQQKAGKADWGPVPEDLLDIELGRARLPQLLIKRLQSIDPESKSKTFIADKFDELVESFERFIINEPYKPLSSSPDEFSTKEINTVIDDLLNLFEHKKTDDTFRERFKDYKFGINIDDDIYLKRLQESGNLPTAWIDQVPSSWQEAPFLRDKFNNLIQESDSEFLNFYKALLRVDPPRLEPARSEIISRLGPPDDEFDDYLVIDWVIKKWAKQEDPDFLKSLFMPRRTPEATGGLISLSKGGLLMSDRQQYQEGDEVIGPWTEEDERRWTEGREGINDPVIWTEAEKQQRERVDQTHDSYQRLLLKNAEALAKNPKFGRRRTRFPLLSRLGIADRENRISLMEEYFNQDFKTHSNTAIWAGTTLPHSTAEEGLNAVRAMAEQIIEEREELKGGGLLTLDRQQYQEAGPVMPPPQEAMPLPQETMPLPEDTMPLPEETVEDEQMEDDYLDYVISQSLNEEEENYLMDTLEADPRLSMIFDKVMDTATEFAGSGPVEGPGSEVSDSIPARLSDGEFVITAKATDEIGPDNLQSIMNEAEVRADQRQTAQEGGLIREDLKEKTGQTGPPVDQEIRRGMLGVNPRLQTTR